MLSLVKDFEEYQFVIAGAPSQEYSFYHNFIKSNRVHFVNNKTYDLLSVSTAALVTSGTATLETALFKVPQVVCYKGSAISYQIAKGSFISYQIAKRIITLKFISLVNLIMDKEVVTELIQGDFNKKRLKKELERILKPDIREALFLDYYNLEKALGGAGASKKTAQLIFESLKS